MRMEARVIGRFCVKDEVGDVLKGRLYIVDANRTVMASLAHQLVADRENEKEKAAISPMASCLTRSQNNRFPSFVTLALDHKCLRSRWPRLNV